MHIIKTPRFEEFITKNKFLDAHHAKTHYVFIIALSLTLSTPTRKCTPKTYHYDVIKTSVLES